MKEAILGKYTFTFRGKNGNVQTIEIPAFVEHQAYMYARDLAEQLMFYWECEVSYERNLLIQNRS